MICYENGNDSLCRQLIEEFSLIHLITQKNKVYYYNFQK